VMCCHSLSGAASRCAPRCVPESVPSGAHPAGTNDAIEVARTASNPRVTLVDGQQFVDLSVGHQDALAVTDRALLPLRPIWFPAQASRGSVRPERAGRLDCREAGAAGTFRR
jgi:hypothetical protein